MLAAQGSRDWAHRLLTLREWVPAVAAEAGERIERVWEGCSWLTAMVRRAPAQGFAPAEARH